MIDYQLNYEPTEDQLTQSVIEPFQKLSGAKFELLLKVKQFEFYKLIKWFIYCLNINSVILGFKRQISFFGVAFRFWRGILKKKKNSR